MKTRRSCIVWLLAPRGEEQPTHPSNPQSDNEQPCSAISAISRRGATCHYVPSHVAERGATMCHSAALCEIASGRNTDRRGEPAPQSHETAIAAVGRNQNVSSCRNFAALVPAYGCSPPDRQLLTRCQVFLSALVSQIRFSIKPHRVAAR